MAPNGGSSDRAAGPEPPAPGVEKRSRRYLALAGKLLARARETLRRFAAMRHSLTLRLLSRVLLFSACVTLILTLLQLYLEYRHDVSALELRLDQIGKTNLDSLAERLWALDENQLRLQLTGILQVPDMRFVEVREARKAGDLLVVKLGEKSASSAITREYPLLYKVLGQNTKIGTLYIEATLTEIYRGLFQTAWTILVSQAAEIFLVSLFIVYIFHNLITRHLFAIATFVDSYRISDPPLPLRLRRPPRRHEDELQRVATAFNSLSDKLQVAYRSLHDINDQLTRDVAARRQVEAVLREREARIRRLVDANIVGVLISDLEGRIFEANDAFLQMVRYTRDDLTSGRLEWMEMTPPEWIAVSEQAVEQLKAKGTCELFEKEYFRSDGTRAPVLVGAALIEGGRSESVAFVLDLTERKRAEEDRERLHQLQADLARINRVTTMGELTASLAHEIKQPIAAAITNANTCLRWLTREVPDIEEAREAAKRTAKAATRAAETISRVRSLFQKDTPERELVDIKEMIAEVVTLLHNEAARYAVSIGTELDADVPQVPADRVQLQQVLVNLIINGMEAMKTVENTRRLTLTSQRDGSDQVRISVSDTGVGLPPEGDQIFNAFFTTKPDGTGMGLAISRSIIESHGGRLWATPNSSGGATFHLSLPTTLEAQA